MIIPAHLHGSRGGSDASVQHLFLHHRKHPNTPDSLDHQLQTKIQQKKAGGVKI